VSTGEQERPEILDVDAEREVLYERLCDRAERNLRITLQPGVTVEDGSVAMAQASVAEVLAALRVLSARQLACSPTSSARSPKSCPAPGNCPSSARGRVAGPDARWHLRALPG
jgi:hypothetical protein